MLHRIRKKNDVNEGKWIGIGGHFEANESPEDCLLREAKEETNLTLTQWSLRGVITFVFQKTTDAAPLCEYMFLYTASAFEGELSDCPEGVLEWIPKKDVYNLPLWEGDRIFFRLLEKTRSVFSLKLTYLGDRLEDAVLDGKTMELFDVRDEEGICTGQTRERSLAHRDGTIHGTAHIWIVRPACDTSKDTFEVLLQKRSANKDAYPGCYDISSAGHLPAGEDFVPGALRELEEELGIYASEADLTQIGYHEGDCYNTFYGEPFHNREISAVFVYQKAVDINTLSLQPEEVESVCWMPLSELTRRVEAQDPLFCIYPGELSMLSEFCKTQKVKAPLPFVREIIDER